MTMEHVLDPYEIASSAYNLLSSGGVFITVTHDYRSIVNRVLNTKSPIIDIEHMQLFSDKSIRELMKVCGYSKVENTSFKNNYAISYWIRLLPLPSIIKRGLSGIISFIKLDKFKLSINVGNQITFGFKNLNK